MRNLPLMTLSTPADEPFLFTVYASTRAEEIDAWGFGAVEAEAFLRMQWDLQIRSYAHQFPDAQIYLIHDGHERAGRIILQRAPDHIRIIDLSLLPEFRSRGIGTSLLHSLQRESRTNAIPLLLSVTPWNPARRLYERLGFEITGGTEMTLSMRWHHGNRQ